ncbi:MAG: hypothetical protein QG585_131 [Patescibacteria group bacterium]|nr:hypothetical protein [Patescibacteria group bacterium]
MEVVYIHMVFYIHPLVAQLVEQLPFKETVVGSIPTEGTNNKTPGLARCFIICPREEINLFISV